MEKPGIKDLLLQLRENDGKPAPGEDPVLLSREILPLIASKDPVLRDELAYSVLAQWIAGNILPDDRIREMAGEVVSDDYLFSGSGSTEESSVLKRSFSVLLLAAIVYRHRQHSLFNADFLRTIKDRIITYIQWEHNLTGYYEDYGWAHAAAHTADLIDELFLCPEFEEDELSQLLEALGALLLKSSSVYCHAEDERLAYAAATLIRTGRMPPERLVTWISALADRHEKNFSEMTTVYRDINIRAFLRCLYIHTVHSGAEHISRSLLEKIRGIMTLQQ